MQISLEAVGAIDIFRQENDTDQCFTHSGFYPAAANELMIKFMILNSILVARKAAGAVDFRARCAIQTALCTFRLFGLSLTRLGYTANAYAI